MIKSGTELQDIIGYSFKDETLLQTALTHSSTGQDENYERLEFLGDRVLGLAIASLLFRKFPNEKEGDLAKRLAFLVQGETLAKLATQINLGDYIIFSDAERDAGGAKNDHILADVFESVIGALYLDGGFVPCYALIETQWEGVLGMMTKPPQHPKTEIQEWAQAQGLALPHYDIIGQSGPDHVPIFEIQLTIKGHEPVTAKGRSRAEAEKLAAEYFMEGVCTS
ncbi:MAG: ribonuclease III [Zetaproteobacteria bacterium]|nr:MAG: ribonuclease III [Zetaproteobacteria bacterium]